MKIRLRLALTALALLATPAFVAAAGTPPAGWPAYLRWDLVPKWIDWSNGRASPRWPPNDGCATPPVHETLPPGTTIDRFGSELGTFFGLRGESFASRAEPDVCENMDYRVYKVLKPLPVKTCQAAPWFGEPGGAKQVQTADPASQLAAAGAIRLETHVVGGSHSPMPQCGRP